MYRMNSVGTFRKCPTSISLLAFNCRVARFALRMYTALFTNMKTVASSREDNGASIIDRDYPSEILELQKKSKGLKD